MSREERLKYLKVAVRMAGIKVSIKDLEIILKLDEFIFSSGGDTTLKEIQDIIDAVNNKHDIQGS